MPLAPGTLLNNRYRIVSILGQGGMGAVYRANDEHLHIPVAVKENLFLTEEYGRQFRREAHILAGLRHTNLPHVTDYFSMENQVQYLVMDYIEGEDLRQRMERIGALPERETVLIGISISDALTYLHTRRPPIVHRDIKPGNIKVTADGQAVLVDFGLAKILQSGQATSTGARAMTPGYSPPEQYGTARTDARSDIYSLGATLYAALTGVIPEDGLARLTGKAKLTPIRDLAPKVNRQLAEVIERALAVEAEDRFQTAEELKTALIEAGELVSYYQERPSIAPAPASEERSPLLNDEASVGEPPPLMEEMPARRRQIKLGWAAGTVFAVLVVAYLLSALRPDIPHAVLAYFNPSTATPTVTQLAAIQTGLVPTELPELETAEYTPSPTLPPAATASPVVTRTAAPTLTQPAGLAATPRGGGYGQIAFASDKSGVMQIWLLDVGNPSIQRQLTNRKDGACQPSWAPDGMRIAFISPCKKIKQEKYEGSNIYIMSLDAAGNPDRESLNQITSSLEGDYDPAWSPDGTRLAFTSLSNGKSAIYVINLSDMSIQELSHSIRSDRQPAWSPDGMQIVFVRQFLTSQIWYMGDNGEAQNHFTFSGPVNNLWPVWSPDRQVIFFSQMQTNPGSIPILFYRKYEDRENPAVEKRIPTSQGDIGPVAEVQPSPDGFWLAYASWPDGKNYDIYIMSVNGSNITRLTTDPGIDFGPAWRPLKPAQQP